MFLDTSRHIIFWIRFGIGDEFPKKKIKTLKSRPGIYQLAPGFLYGDLPAQESRVTPIFDVRSPIKAGPQHRQEPARSLCQTDPGWLGVGETRPPA